MIPKLVPGLPDIDFDVFTGGTLSGSKYISSQSSETITISAPAGRYKVSEYTLIVPSKTVTKYRQVSSVQTLTKYRDITKYRTEIQYRDVIKTQQAQRDINVFMFQRLLGLY